MNSPTQAALPVGEFVALMASMIALTALSIDAMLPALPAIASDLGAVGANQGQFVITAMFVGFAVGQVIVGPLSDSIGRKPAMYIGIAVFMLGATLSLFATDFTTMLVGRVLQGVGAAAPRIVSNAVVRDQYAGDQMAKILSLIMAVFVIIPALAPALGQLILAFAHWRMIFAAIMLQAVLGLLWFVRRQPETLPAQRRVPFSARVVLRAVREVFSNRVAMGHTVAAGLVFSALNAYLLTAQQIFQDLYGVGDMFAVYFGMVALTIGVASVVSSRLVERLGMRRLIRAGVLGISGLGLAFSPFAYAQGGQPPLWTFMLFLVAAFFCVGILFGNLNARAMEPLGHVAGTGAAVIGCGTTVISMTLGALIGQAYDGSVLPLAMGFALLGTLALGLVSYIERAAAPRHADV